MFPEKIYGVLVTRVILKLNKERKSDYDQAQEYIIERN